MDIESYLNLSSPDVNALGEWRDAPTTDDQPEGWDPIWDESAQFEPFDGLVSRAKHSSYTPVLKLSDIASALQGFSMVSAARVAAPDRTNRSATEHVGNEGPKKFLEVVMRKGKHNLDWGEYDDVKPFASAFSSVQKRSLYVPEHDFGHGKRAKLSSTCSDRPQNDTAFRDQPSKSTCKGALTESDVCILTESRSLSQREVHIHCERERRRSMRDYFTTLQSLVPKIKLKHADRITVLTEVITYIQSLRGILEELNRKKSGILAFLGLSSDQTAEEHGATCFVDQRQQKMYAGESSDCVTIRIDVTVRMSGSNVLITLNTPKRKGVWSAVLMLLQRYRVEVVNASLETRGDGNFHRIHGKIANATEFDSDDLQDKLEEVVVRNLRRQPKRLQ